MVLSLLTALTFLAAPAAGQAPAATTATTAIPSLPSAPAVWDPAAQYITVGQDEPGYRAWYGTSALHPIQVKAFND